MINDGEPASAMAGLTCNMTAPYLLLSRFWNLRQTVRLTLLLFLLWGPSNADGGIVFIISCASSRDCGDQNEDYIVGYMLNTDDQSP